MILVWLILAVSGTAGSLLTLGVGGVLAAASLLEFSSPGPNPIPGWFGPALVCSLVALVAGLAGIAVTQYRANRST